MKRRNFFPTRCIPFIGFILLLVLLMAANSAMEARADLEALPDLVVSDFWQEAGLVCYQVYNAGDAASSAGHLTGLLVDGQAVASDPVNESIGAGGRLERCFNFSWSCSAPEDNLAACADSGQAVAEADENNNCRSETWKCDLNPPKITGEVLIKEITSTSATITWTTDEDSDSSVAYDRKTGAFSMSVTNPQPTQAHSVMLSGLQPASLYQFQVRSSDPAGNTVQSPPTFFETQTLADKTPPSNGALSTKRLPGDRVQYRFSLPVTDDDAVERVEFRLDGKLVGIDYSSAPGTSIFEYDLLPGFLHMEDADFFGDHEIRADAFDRFGLQSTTTGSFRPLREIFDGELEIRSPSPGVVVYIDGDVVPDGQTIPFEFHAARYEEDCHLARLRGPEGELYGCREREKAVDLVRIIFNSSVWATFVPGDSEIDFAMNWNLSGKAPGLYTFEVEVLIGDQEASRTRVFEIRRGAASLDVRRNLERDGHAFRVGLEISNPGCLQVSLDDLRDYLVGFQPIPKTSTNYAVGGQYDPASQSSLVAIDLKSGTNDRYTLAPGGRLTIEYLAVPVLYPGEDMDIYQAGSQPLELDYYTATSGRLSLSFERPLGVTTTGESLASGVWAIKEASNYLVVTNPERLFERNPTAGMVDELLGELAHLANAKAGMLAYLTGAPSADEVDDLIEYWGDFMLGSDGSPDRFLSNGYLLLVGENDIVPAHSLTLSPPWYISWLSTRTANPTDVDYADTASNLIDPELNLGRIIGNTAGELLIPVRTILGVEEHLSGYSFDWSHALIVSGWPESRDGGSDHIDFGRERRNVHEKLGSAPGSISELDTHGTASQAIARDLYFGLAPGMDIQHWTGHGSSWTMDDIWSTDFDAYADPFGNANPFIYASSCNTGDYTADYNLATKTLLKGAGLYLGSTEVSDAYASYNASNAFYDRWDPGEAIGPVLKSVKGDIGGYHWDNTYTGYMEDVWSAEYNLYGDPQYGLSRYASGGLAEKALEAPSGPEESLQIQIPAYTLEKTDSGKVVAAIPGGFWLLMPGKPLLPYYEVVYAYAPGTQVQDVLLKSRAGLQTASGIDYLIYEPAEAGIPWTGTTTSQAEAEWFPEMLFDWGVQQDPYGNSELHILIYPLSYNSLTQQMRFYAEYTYEINVVQSAVSIALLAPEKAAYPPQETAWIDLVIEPAGELPDVVVSAAIYELGSYELVDGLLLQTLNNLAAPATFSLSWDPGNTPPGDYTVEAELRDLQGVLLDRRSAPISVGVTQGQAYNLTAPATFQPGEQVKLGFDFKNTGSLALSGECEIRVLNEQAGIVASFSLPFSDLQPGINLRQDVAWDTRGNLPGDYRVTALAYYAGETTPALERRLNSQPRLYLPLVNR